ncbi:hypothetical protein POV27_12750 [Aureisphaera galaxeae]|uniref:hypothetical protein n=1 Tax=Aureisphaera galaxeae TaxID=1538023 RepID=UPI0023501EFB|nr:hypothetical protein [Aureisphaera galaxeae]MDC8004923.1 hypothetical protein [Aureisphaera galaxeae]
MKIIKILGVVVLVLFLASCNKKKKEADNETATTQVEETERGASGENSLALTACDKFLNEYEAWMNGFIEIMARHKDDPVGLVGDPEYTKTMGEGIDWATRWMQQPQACMTNSNYSKRFDAIQERADAKMKELGLK